MIPVTVEEIEDLAMVPNAVMPDRLPMEDQLLFLALRDLHSSHRRGIISREHGAAEKGKLLYEHGKRARLRDIRLRGSKHTAAMWGSIAKYTHAYRKDRTLENADKMLEGIEGEVFQWEQMMEDKA